jgi:ABC-type phosphate transport system permease subunit
VEFFPVRPLAADARMTTPDGPISAGSLQDAFTLRRRPASEKLVDNGFRWLTLLLAGVVAVLLLGIFLTVLEGAREAISSFGLSFLTISEKFHFPTLRTAPAASV